MEKVSVVVPVYNAIDTIDKCCESILIQTYRELELILVDDGSTDGCAEQLEQIQNKDSRVKVIHQKNAGVSAARNNGIRNSTGDWLIFVDADDWIENDSVERALQLIRENNADVAMFSYFLEYNGRSVKYVVDNISDSITTVLEKGNTIKGIESMLCTVWNKIYKLKIIKNENVLFCESVKWGEDFLFNVSYYMKVNRIALSPNILYHYYCANPNSCVKKVYPNYDTLILQMDRALMQLMKGKGIGQDIASDFRDYFIGNRWSYAVDVCLEANISLEEKVSLIHKWINSLDNEMLQWRTIHKGEIGEYIVNRKKRGHLSLTSVKKITMKNILRRRIRKFVTKIKLCVKRWISRLQII